jgi:hypothetical protein
MDLSINPIFAARAIAAATLPVWQFAVRAAPAVIAAAGGAQATHVILEQALGLKDENLDYEPLYKQLQKHPALANGGFFGNLASFIASSAIVGQVLFYDAITHNLNWVRNLIWTSTHGSVGWVLYALSVATRSQKSFQDQPGLRDRDVEDKNPFFDVLGFGVGKIGYTGVGALYPAILANPFKDLGRSLGAIDKGNRIDIPALAVLLAARSQSYIVAYWLTFFLAAGACHYLLWERFIDKIDTSTKGILYHFELSQWGLSFQFVGSKPQMDIFSLLMSAFVGNFCGAFVALMVAQTIETQGRVGAKVADTLGREGMAPNTAPVTVAEPRITPVDPANSGSEMPSDPVSTAARRQMRRRRGASTP